MNELLLGAVAMGSLVAATFFLRFWVKTRERLFAIFALAFLVDAIMRIVLGLTKVPNEQEPLFYIGRLLTFALIVLAILDKNRRGRSPP